MRLVSCSTNSGRARVSLLLAALAIGCADGTSPRPKASAKLSSDITFQAFAHQPDESPTQFTKLTAERTGLDFSVPIDNDHPQRYLYHSGFFCGGIAIGDVDGDEQPDVYLVNGPGKNKLFRQVGDFRFEDITQFSGTDGGDAWGTGVAMVDIDNDGDLDIYVCNYDHPNLLYLNDGQGRFTESAKHFGLDIIDASLQPAFCDYDRDGDLDVYLLTYRYYHLRGAPHPLPVRQAGNRYRVLPEYTKYFGIIDLENGKQTLRPIGRPDRLLRNDDLSFTDVTESAGIYGTGFGLSATWWDYDGDGLFDLYVGNDLKDADRFYRNNGDGTFSDVLAEVVPHSTWYSMGADAADLNNDGMMDFLIADMSATTHVKQKTTMGDMGAGKSEMIRKRPHQYMRNALYVASGANRFLEAAYLAGLADTDWTWAVKLADFDNDGRTDAFFTNGMTRSFNHSDFQAPGEALLRMTEWDAYEKAPIRKEQNLAFRNQGDLDFADVSQEWGLAHIGISGPAAYGDLDRDGDLDLIVMNMDEPIGVYRNQSSREHSVLLRLKGTKSNRFGIGASVMLQSSSGRQIRQLMPMTGYLSSNDPLVHFGLGAADEIKSMIIRWPSGVRQVFQDLAADGLYTITEQDTEPLGVDESYHDNPRMYRPSESLANAAHKESPYDDFQRQPLLPHQLSQLGPGVACGDIDGDGNDDLYLCGASGQAGSLYLNRGKDGFKVVLTGPWQEDKESEDMGALFFDADGDGDSDLFVASGGVECEPGDSMLIDRLYLNDGEERFTKAPPNGFDEVRESSSVVACADFDRDGDLDLFVGSRVIPGRYPLPPRSHLWRNEGGKFTDVTDEVASTLRETGLVTGAIWSDADNDGWIDLLVTHEWGPVKFFRNEQGRLSDQTTAMGLADLTGWWNGIAARDLNADGYIDYVASNFSLNSKYHASQERPALLYYGDFGRNGKMSLVEAEFEDETLFPIRGKSCSTQAMPFLADRFKTYESFAAAPLEGLYTPECLSESHRFAATTLSSGVFINRGGQGFEFHPLPRLAQIAPSFGIVVTEVNGDGHADLFFVQNFFSPQWETGRMDGGLSLLLTGNGDGNFDPVLPGNSGLIVSGDAKGLAVCDMNGDSLPDFIIGVNDAPWRSFEHTGHLEGDILQISLKGKKGNPAAVGARVSVHLKDGPRQVAEVSAGGGYLSQSTASLFFGLGVDGRVDRIEVVWPNGEQSIVQAPPDSRSIRISQPD